LAEQAKKLLKREASDGQDDGSFGLLLNQLSPCLTFARLSH